MDPILAKRQLGEINRAMSALVKAEEECTLAENCGVDCDQRRTDIEQARLQLQLFKSTYFPSEK